MKIIVIGDVHGRNKWKSQVGTDADKYIFIGDYFDSFTIDGKTQIENFMDILEFKSQNPEKVELLAGNHCLSFMHPQFIYKCSGFQPDYANEIYDLLRPLYDNRELKACVVLGNDIYVHAGVSQTWCDKYGVDTQEGKLESSINELFYTNLDAFAFQIPSFRKLTAEQSLYGDNIYQSPLWIRPNSLQEDALPNYRQIVGHTSTKWVEIEPNLIKTDCQEYSDEYLMIDYNQGGKPIILE